MKSTQLVPRINVNDLEVEIISWLVTEHAFVEKGQDLAELGTSKATFNVQAEYSGFVSRQCQEGNMIEVGEPLAQFASTIEELADLPSIVRSESRSHEIDGLVVESVASLVTTPSSPPREKVHGLVRFSKSAEALIARHQLSRDLFDGLVTESVVREYLYPKTGKESTRSPARLPDETCPSTLRTQKVGRGKLAEIENLQRGEEGNINSSLTVQFSSSAIRVRIAKEGLFNGSILPLIIFEVSRLLESRPAFTAFYQGEQIVFYDRVDLGIAIDLGKGLKVVSLTNANELLPIEIHESLIGAATRYVENQLTVEELTSSTLTITDLSQLNILSFQPLINGKQSVILGLGGDTEAPGQPFTITATFDHRVLTGKEVGGFLNTLKERLQSYGASTAAPSANPNLTFSSCDYCEIGINEYYELFKRDAMMQTYVRPDGALGSICHSCLIRS